MATGVPSSVVFSATLFLPQEVARGWLCYLLGLEVTVDSSMPLFLSQVYCQPVLKKWLTNGYGSRYNLPNVVGR